MRWQEYIIDNLLLSLKFTHTHTRTHTHTCSPCCLTCAIAWQSEFVRYCKIVKCVRDIVKISICFIPQIIVYEDGRLLGFEQTPKWIAFKNTSVYFVISLSQALTTYFPFHLMYTLILYSNYYWISRCLEKKLMIREITLHKVPQIVWSKSKLGWV